jgi:phospholipid/cholesterol/gamma-HCH transport system substrate-binding protein
MKKLKLELVVGIFMLTGILMIGFMTIKLGNLNWISESHYSLKAKFSNISGLVDGAAIEIAGVKVGYVSSIKLDKEFDAELEFRIKKGIILTDDVIASVKTYGIIGDKYIKLLPGGSDDVLKNGDYITETESTIDIEELVSKYIFGKV